PGAASANSAHLLFTVTNRFGPGAFNGDLYGLAARASPTVLQSDFFIGPSDGTATLIQDNILTSATAANASTDATGDANLLSFLNTQYAAGASGKYVFLRFSPDPTDPGLTGTYVNDGQTVGQGETPGSAP